MAESFRVELPVDDEPVRFDGFRCGAASATVGELRITIAGSGVLADGIRLRRLADPLSGIAV